MWKTEEWRLLWRGASVMKSILSFCLGVVSRPPVDRGKSWVSRRCFSQDSAAPFRWMCGVLCVCRGPACTKAWHLHAGKYCESINQSSQCEASIDQSTELQTEKGQINTHQTTRFKTSITRLFYGILKLLKINSRWASWALCPRYVKYPIPFSYFSCSAFFSCSCSKFTSDDPFYNRMQLSNIQFVHG